MSTVASEITSSSIVCSTVGSGVDQRKHQSSTSLTFVQGIHQGPVNSLHKWAVTRKMFPFVEVMILLCLFVSAGGGCHGVAIPWCLADVCVFGFPTEVGQRGPSRGHPAAVECPWAAQGPCVMSSRSGISGRTGYCWQTREHAEFCGWKSHGWVPITRWFLLSSYWSLMCHTF